MSVIHNPHFHKLKCWWLEFSHLLSDEEYWETKQIALGSPTGSDIKRLDAIVCDYSPEFAQKRQERLKSTSGAVKSLNTYQVEPITPENFKVLITDEQARIESLETRNKKLEEEVRILGVELSATYQRAEQFRKMIK